MMHEHDRTLVVHDGSLAALVACLMAPELHEVVAWMPPSGSPLRGLGAPEQTQASLVTQQAELLGYGGVASGEPLSAQKHTGEPQPASRSIQTSRHLLEAIAAAQALGCRRVIWPVVAGESMSEMAEAAERAALLNRLCWLGLEEPRPRDGRLSPEPGASAGKPIRVETPFVDLTSAQVLEMAEDLGAPMQLCWDAPAVTA